ncbi:saccharopine dehydrogenase family protein [Sandaracinus amylolyticus]|uniref:saccharopine dehydrogenase family protein n=1 Tax=Sandaracinus amylolyticus TaxID=927083 RepID=UPI001F3B4C0B|nr:saccharopine dehydrogenase NADP-binding domain-containing protein [Sandaracinus amylolyticus]UJR82103.1 Trans-acting enoyl reductase [Sandaracinus amylolyticus]
MTALLYGAYGYTGELTARVARERGLDLILAGRDPGRTIEVAARYGMPHRVFSLDDPEALDTALEGVRVVLHCAGPFSRTSRPMVDACLRNRVHYLDITGELEVFEACAQRDEDAKRAGVMVLPGAGFDVVPSDCLAAHLARRLPDATHLALGFLGTGAVSHGTATTMIENIHRGSAVRRDGRIVPIPAGSIVRTIDYGARRPRLSMAIPWGDVSTAFHSTRIPNIDVFIPATQQMIAGARAMTLLAPVMGSRPVQRLLKRVVDARPAGPTDAQRAKGASFLWGEVKNAKGETRVSRMRAPEGYTLTADASLAIVQRVLRGEAKPGFQTPSRAFGADFVLELPNVTRSDE